MSYEHLHPVINVIGRDLGIRPNMNEVCSLLQEDEPTLLELFGLYDTAITIFNRLLDSDINPSWTNTLKLKQALGENTLTTIDDTLKTSDLSQLLDDIGPVSKRMAVLMKRGEMSQEEPFLQFHIATDHIDPNCLRQSLTVGTLSHFYELYLLQTTEFTPRINPGIIECALIEILSQAPQNELWLTFSQRDRLNWVDNWEGFSKAFRQEHGFS